MKIKLILLIIIFISCTRKNGHDTIKVINKCNRNLIFEFDFIGAKYSRMIGYTGFYINNNPKNKKDSLNKEKFIGIKNESFFYDSFEKNIIDSQSKYFTLYIFNLDSLLKYRKDYKMSYLVENKLYDKKINLTIDTLNKLNWVVTIDNLK